MLKISLLFKKFTKFTENNSRILRIKNTKFSGYSFYMKTNIQGHFQICVSVPLKQETQDIFTQRKEKRYFYTKILKCFKRELRDCSYGGQLARLGGLARLGEISPSLKSDSHLRKRFCVICLIESTLENIKNAFYFILKALLVLKIFKFL